MESNFLTCKKSKKVSHIRQKIMIWSQKEEGEEVKTIIVIIPI